MVLFTRRGKFSAKQEPSHLGDDVMASTPAAATSRKAGPKGIPAPKTKAASKDQPPVKDAPASDAPAASEDTTAHALKLRELVARVVEATGGKKKGVKEIVEATLTQLGDALIKGEELNLPGVGKIKVARTVDRAGRAMMTLKMRSNGTPKKKEPQEALAEAGEDV
jgi:nucleoid DNA-binding protein